MVGGGGHRRSFNHGFWNVMHRRYCKLKFKLQLSHETWLIANGADRCLGHGSGSRLNHLKRVWGVRMHSHRRRRLPPPPPPPWRDNTADTCCCRRPPPCRHHHHHHLLLLLLPSIIGFKAFFTFSKLITFIIFTGR